MDSLLSLNTTIFELLGYKMSLLELTATLSGLGATWYAARENIITWPFALINAILFCILFYQVNLYSAMVLQIFFFGNAIYGWANWRRDSQGVKKPVTMLPHKMRVWWLTGIFAGMIILGSIMSRIHLWLPSYFPEKARFVYSDAMVAVMSIAASVLLARLKIENWVLWILIDIMSIAMYAMRGIMLVSIQYLIFLFMASYGFIEWRKKISSSPPASLLR
jgi:nicotinamide mononucleotide transporter